MDIVVFALSALCVIFVLISVAIPFSERTRLPLPIVIAVAGLAMGFATVISGVDVAGRTLDAYDLWFIHSLALDSEIMLVVFLPPLLFEMALHVNVRRLMDDAALVALMAIVAVVLATAVVGGMLWAVSSIGLVACLLLGAAISTTDPAAVVTTFRQIGAPRRLLVILEGESLLNDAAAIALFTALIAIARHSEATGIGAVLAQFGYGFSVGAVCGVATGWLASRIYPLLGRSSVAETTITVALAYGSYLIADRAFGASGVVSVVFAGITTTGVGMVRMGPRNWSLMTAVWSQISFWANALILLLAAMIAPQMLVELSPVEGAYLLIVYLGAFGARAAVLYGMLPVLSRLKMLAPVDNRQKTLVLWGGVRGAVTLVLALSLAEAGGVDEGERQVISTLAAAFAFTTLFLNASTLRLAMRRLGLNRLSDADIALRERIVAGTVAEVRAHVSRLAEERAIEPTAVAEMQGAYDLQIRDTITSSQDVGIPFGERLRLGLTILANQELRVVVRAFQGGAIGPALTRELRLAADRIADASRMGGRSGYERAMAQALAFAGGFRWALYAQRYARFGRPLRVLLANRLGMLLESETTVRELAGFVQQVMPTMIGEDAAHNLADLLDHRLKLVRGEIDAIRRQYPNYTSQFERTVLMRAGVLREAAQYERLAGDGIIGPELHRTLIRDVEARRRRLNRPPKLDLGLSPTALVAQVPIFDALDGGQRHRIVRRLRSRLVVPGETVVAHGTRGDTMYFVASGVLEVRGLDEEVRLSNGDFFGELAVLLPHRRRRTDVVAVTFCRLLQLRRRDFRALTAKDPAIKTAIRRAAEQEFGAGFRAMLREEMDWSEQPSAGAAKAAGPHPPAAGGMRASER